jgi:proteasome lid subunit RPN8/RPN11
MNLPNNVKQTIKEHSLREQPNECCGLVINQQGELVGVECKNVAENTVDTFAISPKDYVKASNRGKIVTYYHSHLENNFFSEFDKFSAESHKIPATMYCISKDSFNYYIPNGYEIPYTGRQYVLGYMDCYALVLDYFRNEKNIVLKDLESPYRFVNDLAAHPDNAENNPVLLNHFVENGFIEVKDPKPYDVFLTRNVSIQSPLHCIINLGSNQILHHPYKKDSLIEPYIKFWKNRTVHILRHRELV